MCKLNIFDKLSLIIVFIGSVNWGLIGLFNYNLVAELFGAASWFTKLVYILVGVSGLWAIAFYGKNKDRT